MLDVRYRLEERIAAGGVGQVWRATDLLLRRPVAVKVLRPEYAGHPETLDRFRAEARHAGALPHPCITQVYDYCDGGPDAAPYLVMELIDGPSLADILDFGAINAARALGIIAQAAAGLAAAHQAGLVHRDIKPANILLSRDGRVKLTDFGIAHAAGSAPVTAPELIMGTAQYLAPERITGQTCGPASDLYSLGIVLYECLTGRPPFDGTSAEVMSAHLHAQLPPLPSGVPPAIGELLARLTAKDPALRLPDAAELATTAGRLSAAPAAIPAQPPADLGGKMAPGSPAESGSASGPATLTRTEVRPRRPSRRRRFAVMTAAVALAAVSGGLAVGAFRVTVLPGTAAPSRSHVFTPPTSTGTPAVPRGVTPSRTAEASSGRPGKRSARPSPSPDPSGETAPAPGRKPSTHATNTPRPTGTSRPRPGVTRSGSGVELRLPLLPGLGISLGL
jgi:serine/threonine protein kinase